MSKIREVRKERTGWRDKQLDELLESHGIRLPNSFLVTEYNYGKSVAMIEYKNIRGSTEGNQAIIQYTKLRQNEEYYFIVLYDYEQNDNLYRITKFIVYPINDVAIRDFGDHPIEMSELEYIDFLYKIRKNEQSVYKTKALEEYQEWFEIHVQSDPEKEIISHRHRNYAYDVPAADIDCMMVDRFNIPYLFIEYKSISKSGSNYFIDKNMNKEAYALAEKSKENLYNKAIADLGNGCKEPLPVIAVQYDLENKIFTLYAFNNQAKEMVTLGNMYEDEYFKYILEPSNFETFQTCPICGNELIKKNGIYGSFIGCSGFKVNKCKYSRKIVYENKKSA